MSLFGNNTYTGTTITQRRAIASIAGTNATSLFKSPAPHKAAASITFFGANGSAQRDNPSGLLGRLIVLDNNASRATHRSSSVQRSLRLRTTIASAMTRKSSFATAALPIAGFDRCRD